jgi:hypothetical protein
MVLDILFDEFPGAAKVLPKDAGLYNGPRPMFYQGRSSNEALSQEVLAVLRCNERMVVLCSDVTAESIEEQLRAAALPNTVMGIRASKGLEFSDVLILNFFADTPKADQKAWKVLLSTTTVSSRHERVSYPQLEAQLKMLYTAVTRSCDRLVFVENTESASSSAFFRLLKAKQLAEPFDAGNEGATVMMLSDEWRARGINFAMSAEGDRAIAFLTQAKRCFECAGDKPLIARTSIHLELEILRHRLLTEEISIRDELEAASLLCRSLTIAMPLPWSDTIEMCELLSTKVCDAIHFQREILYKMKLT